MLKFFKKYGINLLLIIVLIILALWYTRRKNIAFDFNVGGNISNLLSSLQTRYAEPSTAKGFGLYLEVPLTTTITNNSAAQVVLENIMGSISYSGEPIFQTKVNSQVLNNVPVAAKSSKPVTDSVQVLINPSSIKFFSELVKGNKPSVKYNFNTTILGKPQTFTNITTIKS